MGELPADTGARTDGDHPEDTPVVVVGAEPAGLAAAEAVLDAGLPVVVVDLTDPAGPCCGTVSPWGRPLDLAPLGLPADADPAAVARWLDLAGAVGGVHRTRARRSALWRGRTIPFPPGPAAVLPGTADRRTALVAETRLAGGRLAAAVRRGVPGLPRPAGAHSALVDRYGNAVVEELLVPHCRKHWGTHPRDLPTSFADRLHRTLRAGSGRVDLLTPREGGAAVWGELARRLRARGATFLQGAAVTGLAVAADRVRGIRLRDGDSEFTLETRAVVTTVPARQVLSWLPGTRPADGPTAGRRDRHLVHLLLEDAPGGGTGLDGHDVTSCDPELRVGRLTAVGARNPGTARSEPGSDPRSVLRAEFWSSGDDDLSACSDHELVRIAIGELPDFGVDPRVRVLDSDVLRLPATVPVPTPAAARARAEVDARLSTFSGLWVADLPDTDPDDGWSAWQAHEAALLLGRDLGDRLRRSLTGAPTRRRT